MTDPASPAAKTEPNHEEARLLAEMIKAESNLARCYLARGLELARVRDELHDTQTAYIEKCGDSAVASIAAEARLAQANEALKAIAEARDPHGDQTRFATCSQMRDYAVAALTALDRAAPASCASGTEDLDIDAMYERARHCGPMGEDLRQFSDDEVKAIIERYRAQASALAEARRDKAQK